MGLALMAFSACMGLSPAVLEVIAKLRGRSFDATLYCLWQVIAVSLGMFVSGWILARKSAANSWVGSEVKTGWILMSGFFTGILLSLTLVAGFGNSGTPAYATELRLFNFQGMNEFTSAGTAAASAAKAVMPLREFKTFLSVYVFRNHLLILYSLLFGFAFWAWQSTRRYIWPSLALFGTGFLFMLASSFRYYAEQYWIYVDFFFMAACALLVFGLVDRARTISKQLVVLAALGLIYFVQYRFVADDYPKYNFDLRDKIDDAGHAIYRVPDYADLMTRRYGDDPAFMRKVLSDPVANGSDRGINILSKRGVQNVIRTFALSQSDSSELRVAFRYDDNRVITNIGDMEDPVKIKMSDLKSLLKHPVTKNSVCGYLIPLTSERLRTFTPHTGTVPVIGQQFTVFLGGNATVTATVEAYVEGWQGDPLVGIDIIARVQSQDQARFEKTESGYYLISSQPKPGLPQTIPDPNPGMEVKTRTVLNRFGDLGDLIERVAEAGWDTRLFRMSQGSLRATDVASGCGD